MAQDIDRYYPWRTNWGHTALNVGGWAISWLSLIMMGLMGLLVIIVFAVAIYDSYRFDQPRDAIALHLPGYNQAYVHMKGMCATSVCSQKDLDRLVFPHRSAIVKAGWPAAVDVMTNRWRWKMNDGNGWQIRDGWFDLVKQVGGPEEIKQCQPLIIWDFGPAQGIVHSFQGVMCDQTKHLLVYRY